MRKKARIVALATALMLLVGSIIPVGAFDGTKTLKALFKNYQIVVNGSVLISDKEPFIVDGTTYVPVRLVAEATGANVEWDGAKGRVVITTAPTVDKAQIDKSYRDGYDAGIKAGELSGYLKGLEEGRTQIKSDQDKKKEYDKGYKDGQEKGKKDGFAAGENDYDRNRKSDWERNLDSDSSLTKTYKLSSQSDEYAEGFLDGYKDSYKSSYRDGFDSYDSYYDAYDDGWVDGYYDGYSKGKSDGRSNRTYNDRVPTSSTITSDYGLDSKSKNYRDGFIEGYRDNYQKGYDDGYNDRKQDPNS